MTFLRWVFVLLLCAALPIYGNAATAAPEYCAMQKHSEHCEMQSLPVHGAHVCCHCDHMRGKMKPGHTCQCDQCCATYDGHLSMTSHTEIQAPVQISQIIAPAFYLPHLTQDPDGFWRPPRIV